MDNDKMKQILNEMNTKKIKNNKSSLSKDEKIAILLNSLKKGNKK